MNTEIRRQRVLRVRAKMTSHFRIPSSEHLRPALNREILNAGQATPAVSLNPAGQIYPKPGRELWEVILARTPILAVSLFVLLTAGFISNSTGAETGDLARFLVITDIHFDPFYNGNLINRLVAKEPREWPAIFESTASGFSPYGTDANYRLLKSAWEDAQAREPRPDFILYPGDFLAHYWQSKFDKFANDKSEAAYRAFTNNVVRFFAQQFSRYFPNVPVLPTLGNEDSYCGDYQIQPKGPFLQMFAKTWSPLLGQVEPGKTDFDEVFPKGGYFSMPLPRLDKHRLIVLNTNFFSSVYTNRCGDPSQDPGKDQLEWLRVTLERARLEGDKVWLLMHIPFGIDVFDTLLRGVAAAPLPFWHPAYTEPFFELMRRYQSRIQAVFSGHVHMDTFNVLRGLDGQPILFNHIAPAISPIFGNNPGYQLFSYMRNTGELVNYTTFYLSNLTADSFPTTGHWKQEYDFNGAYGLAGINQITLQTLSLEVARDPQVQKKYMRYYNVSHTSKPAISQRSVKAYQCALEQLTPQSFEKCRRGEDGERPQETEPPLPTDSR